MPPSASFGCAGMGARRRSQPQCRLFENCGISLAKPRPCAESALNPDFVGKGKIVAIERALHRTLSFGWFELGGNQIKPGRALPASHKADLTDGVNPPQGSLGLPEVHIAVAARTKKSRPRRGLDDVASSVDRNEPARAGSRRRNASAAVPYFLSRFAAALIRLRSECLSTLNFCLTKPSLTVRSTLRCSAAKSGIMFGL